MSIQPSSKWNDDLIALLKTLHADGMSFEHMTRQPGFKGSGFTRNALIGKANRIGLTQRSTEARNIAVRVNSGLASKGGHPLKAPAVARAPNQNAGLAFGTRKLAAPEVKADPYIGRSLTSKLAASADRPVGQPLPETAPPPTDPVRFEDLRAHHCRWPIGDPQDPAFGFCGARRLEAKPYCADHCKVAYQPLPARAPKDGRALARSLRRFTA